MITQAHPIQRFWIPIFTGTATAVGLFVLFGYIDSLNIIVCLGIIPFSAGFITLLCSTRIQQTDRFFQIMLPWAALIITLFFPTFWRLRFFIILVFPMASVGGIAASLLLKKLRQ